ncbi:MAG: ATP-binding protein, partial [Clostridia bacterium]|nr:ATP-binding protein [Clostridia bacterium]
MININNKSWLKLRFSDIKKHLEGVDDETFFFEYKSDETSNDKFINEVSAFANTFGGYIFLGIKDDKTIDGCTLWTEQRIHSVLHNCITPTPNFDIKKFRNNNKTIFIIKIEEGAMPPYITNKGKIYERISSGSFVIKDSSKLSQLYYKREEQLKNLENKLYITELPESHLPQNICAYLDIGIALTFAQKTAIQQNFYKFDLSKVSEYLQSLKVGFTLSRL